VYAIMQADLILIISNGFGRDYNEGNPEVLHVKYSVSPIVAQLIRHGCFCAKLTVLKGFVSFCATLNHNQLVTEPKTTIP